MPISITAACHWESLIAGSAVLLWILLIIVLHFLKPQLNPAISMASEYARGKHGWLMQVAFYSMAVGCFTLTIAGWPYLYHVGLLLLVIIGVSFAGAGVFVTDPPFTPKENATLSGNLHTLFSAIAILLFPVMVTILSADIQYNNILGYAHIWIVLAAILVWIGCFSFFGSVVLAVRRKEEQHKPVPFGYYQRFMIFAMSGWLVVLAMSLITSASLAKNLF